MGGFHLFTLANIPVRVNPWLFLLLFMLGRGLQPKGLLLFVPCAVLSLLVHEFGHALVARRYKLNPEILLHGWGGLTAHQRASTPGQEAKIIAAGPFAGLLLFGTSYLVNRYVALPPGAPTAVFGLLEDINFYWSIFNLMPMWPLDGGQLLRLGAMKIWQPARGERIAHIASIVVVGLVAFFAYQAGFGGPLMLIMLGLTAWQNFQALSAAPGASPRRDNPHARQLLLHAEAAYQAGNDEEAARLCHQLRSEGNVPPLLLARAWAILGVTTTRRGEHEEALSYLQRAPDLPEVVEAKAQCLYELGQYDALEELVGTNGFARLPEDTRKLILDALRDALQTQPA